MDAAEEGIEAARLHSGKDPRVFENLTYVCRSIEDHAFSLEDHERYDAVIVSEVLEHVACVDTFLDSCCDAIKPGGSLFVTCMERTYQSYLIGILIAENVLGILPKGTHDWNKFLPIKKLREQLTQSEVLGC